jgi:phosphoglycerate kinase
MWTSTAHVAIRVGSERLAWLWSSRLYGAQQRRLDTMRNMTTDQDRFAGSLGRLCDRDDPAQSLALDALLEGIPRLSDVDLRAEQSVIIRGDLDVPLDGASVADPTRLESCVRTLRHCIDSGVKVILIGHIGRNPSATLRPVAGALTDLLGVEVTFVPEWFDESEWRILPVVGEKLEEAAPGSVMLLENLRRYSFERALWDVSPETLATGESERLFDLARQFAVLSGVLINEAIAASNRDFSSAGLPFVMNRSALGYYVDSELRDFAAQVVLADCLVFSGLKANKLDDLEGIVDQGHVRDLIVGGSLAMSLVKAEGDRRGKPVTIGIAESDPTYVAYVSPDRVAQAARILDKCSAVGAAVHLPIDYLLDDGTVSEAIPDGRTQLDIGPATAAAYSEVIADVAQRGRHDGSHPIMFLNGVMGMVEDSRFTAGTSAIFEAIAGATAAGAKTYVGGGDGRAALARFGFADQVTHAFTAGGTILKLMSGRAIPYLLSMYLSNQLMSEG